MQKYFIKFILIVLSMTPSLKVYADIGKNTANLYCKKSGIRAGEVRSYTNPDSFHWEDIPLAVLRCDVFGDTLDVERAMKDILQWPAMKITQSDLDKSLENLPSIKVDYTSGGSAAKCTDGKYTRNIIYKGFKPEVISQFLHNDKTVNFNTSLIPLDTLRQSELGCLLRGSNLGPTYIPSSDPIYKEEATKKLAQVKENLKNGLSKVLPNSIGSKN